jgi:hypothetical protein
MQTPKMKFIRAIARYTRTDHQTKAEIRKKLKVFLPEFKNTKS